MLFYTQHFAKNAAITLEMSLYPTDDKTKTDATVSVYPLYTTYIYILDSHRRLTAPVKPHEAKFEAVQPAEQ